MAVTTEPAAMMVTDAAQRERALDWRASFIVQAPAGSGKTELLIQRMLALLGQVDAPEEVMALTFTRKAAGEMRARVLDALDAASAPQPPSLAHARTTWALARAVHRRDAEAGWGLRASPNRLRIMTIDALCANLARQRPVLSAFGTAPATLEDAGPLYAQAARRTLAMLDQGDDVAAAVARLLQHTDNDAGMAEALLAQMLQRRDQWLRHVADPSSARLERSTLEAALERAVQDALQGVHAATPEALLDELLALACHAAGNLLQDGATSAITCLDGIASLPGTGSEALPQWRAIAALLLTREGAPRQRVDRNGGFPAPSTERDRDAGARRKAWKARFEALLRELQAHPAFIARLHGVRALPPPAYGEAQWSVLAALAQLLPVAVAQLTVLFGERGEVDFTAVAQGAAQALGSDQTPTDLALALDYRIRHVLVDEFQDTSLAQFELLRRLTAGWQPGDGRTLFLVGDPMQSIYRFREAEVALFLNARQHGVGDVRLEPLTLSVNFRSQASLVEWVNCSFAALLPQVEDPASGAVTYSASQAQHAALPGTAVAVHALLARDRAAEARVVVDLVRAACVADPAQRIAILVRSRSHLAEIVPLLQNAGLRPQAIEIEALAHRPVVRDLHALTRALLHPADRIAWLALLRAPWCGLTLPDLEALAGDDHRSAIWTLLERADRCARLGEEARARVERVRAVLSACIQQRRRGSLRRWVEGAWLALGGAAAARDAADLEDAQVFLGLLEALEQGGDVPDFAELDRRMAALYARPDQAADERLQVMTIHKAKGLEFDQVIVPGLGFAARRTPPQLLLWLERARPGQDTDLLLAPLHERGQTHDAIYEYLAALERSKTRHEDTRLLYVAATRARSRLHWIGHASVNGAGPQPASGSLLEILWPMAAAQFRAAAERARGQDVAPSAGAIPRPPTILRRLPARWQPELDASAPVPVEVAPAAETALPAVEFSWASETARHVGSVVHATLQRIAEQDMARWSAHEVTAWHAGFARDLRVLGVPEANLQEAVARVARALTAAVEDARARWILAAHAEAASELRLTAMLDGRIVHVALDRTFVDEHGTRWIIDYKTSTHEGGDLEAFLDREQLRYREQLERYARIMRAMDGRPVRLGLYFPLLAGWREWGPD